MIEILWKNDDPGLPLKEQEFYELRMVDFGIAINPRFFVREIHVADSDKIQQIVCNGYKEDLCRTAEEAERAYRSRKAAIVAKVGTTRLEP